MRQLMIIIVASFLMTADVHAKNISLSGVQAVKVDLNDSAKGACWTSLKEVREYAEEKFRIKEIKVVEEYPKRNDRVVFEKGMYLFKVIVDASRLYTDGSGPCIGFIQISFHTHTWINNVWHLAGLNSFTSRAKNKTNFNNYAIRGVQSLFDDFQ